MSHSSSLLATAIALVLVSSNAAYASVYGIGYANLTSTVQTPSVVLQGGTAGSSTVSSVAADAATVAVTAGLTFYENANAPTTTSPPTGCKPPRTDTALAQPTGSRSYSLGMGMSACLWSPSYASSSVIYSGIWVIDLWASAGKAGYTLSVSVYTTDSAGNVLNTIINAQPTNSIPTSKGEVKTSLSGGSGNIPGGGYLLVVLTNPTGAGRPTFTIYWGTGQLSNFQTPTTYNYVLVINNPTSSSWTINLGVASTSTLSRLTNVTIWFTSPFSKQIVVSSGSVTQSSGSTVTLSATSTINIAVAAFANAMPTGSNSPSSIVLSLKVKPSSATPYVQYTISLKVG